MRDLERAAQLVERERLVDDRDIDDLIGVARHDFVDAHSTKTLRRRGPGRTTEQIERVHE